MINDKDLRIDVYRAQGAGGQHVNKTESAVRITHLPTGIAVAQQTEKSQHKNKAQAMKMLKAKLYEMERQRVDSARAAERKSMVGSGDRSERIRTYNFPQGRVTDHRINLTLYKLDRIISGDELGEIVDALVARGPGRADLPRLEADGLSGDPVGDAARRLPRPASTMRGSMRGCCGNLRRTSRPPLWSRATRPARSRSSNRSCAVACDREPVAYIVGRKEFWSLDFAVGPGALIPRPDSETLIEALCKAFPDKSAPLSFLDLGTGTGCLLIAALKEYPNARGVGVDQSDDALVWALRNISLHKLEARATLIQSGWLEEATPGFDAVLCNPPYIPTAEIASLSADVRLYEPHPALDGGTDGLAAYRALAPRIARLLKSHGRAFLEIGVGQDTAVPAVLAAAGVQVLGIEPDLGGNSTLRGGRAQGSGPLSIPPENSWKWRGKPLASRPVGIQDPIGSGLLDRGAPAARPRFLYQAKDEP